MKASEFAYWLNGFFEIAESNTGLSQRQLEIIKNHLKLVFLYDIDPSYSKDARVQKIMQNVHDGKEPMEGVSVEKPKPSQTLIKC